MQLELFKQGLFDNLRWHQHLDPTTGRVFSIEPRNAEL